MAGDASVQECVDTFAAYVHHPQFHTGLVLLTETRDLIRVETGFRGVVSAVQRSMPLLRRFPKGSRSVIHAPGDLNFGLARMLQQVVAPISPLSVEIHRDAAAALACAGQPETSFADLESALTRAS